MLAGDQLLNPVVDGDRRLPLRLVVVVAQAGVTSAGQENFLAALLCTTMWITCAKRSRACARYGEMLGIILPGHAHIRDFTWESTIHALWMEKKAELSTRHAAIAHK